MATTLGQLSGSKSSGPAIPYLGYYTGQNYFDEDPTKSPLGQQFLSALQKYDPNATFVQTTMGGEGGGNPAWTLQYDQSKLPTSALGNQRVDLNPNEYLPQYWSPQSSPGEGMSDVLAQHPDMGNFRGQLFNDKAVINDPFYGRITSQANVKPDAPGWLDKFGPLLVSAFGMGAPMLFGAAGLGMGAGASAAIGAANGGLAAAPGGVAGLGAPSAFGTAIGRGLPNIARSVGEGRFNPLSLVPLVGAGFGLPSWMTSGATTLGNLARGGKPQVNPVALALQGAGVIGGGIGG